MIAKEIGGCAIRQFDLYLHAEQYGESEVRVYTAFEEEGKGKHGTVTWP